jgi:hypothetical protein
MPEEKLDQNGGSGGQKDPGLNVNVNDPGGDPKPGEGGNPGDGGEAVVNFIDSIPEADREGFGDFEGKTVDEFVKHYKGLQDGKITIPDSYEAIENIEIKHQGNYDTLTKFCKDDLGLTQGQFAKLLPAMVQRDQAVLSEFEKSVTDMNEAELDKVMTEQAETAKASLTQEWGGDYEKKTAAASGLVAALSDDDFVEYLSETGLGNDPRMLKAFYKLSTFISEDNFVEGKIVENDVRRDPQTGKPILKFKSMD